MEMTAEGMILQRREKCSDVVIELRVGREV